MKFVLEIQLDEEHVNSYADIQLAIETSLPLDDQGLATRDRIQKKEAGSPRPVTDMDGRRIGWWQLILQAHELPR